MAEVTSKGGKTTEVNNGKLVIDEANNRLVQDDGNTYRLILGKLPNGDINFIIVKEGVDAFDVFS